MSSLQHQQSRCGGGRALTLLSCLALLAVSCGDASDEAGSSGGKPGSAGELVVATATYDTLDPAKQSIDFYKASQEPAMAVLDTMLRLGSDGEVEPQLAESMETSDGQVWTLTLRPDLTFTDGTPLDAEAVLFNIERQRDPANAGVAGRNLASLESVRAVDERTVEFSLNEVDSTFDELFAGVNGLILSPTAYKEDPDSLVGAGPYTLEEVVPDSHILLKRNPDYWDPDKPAYETVRYRQVDDPLARGEAIAAGEIDIAQTTGAETILQVGDLEQAGVKLVTANATYMVLLNHSRGPTQDVRVREAISLAFDPERVNDALMGGLWSEMEPPLEMPCPPFSPEDPECVEGTWPEYDPEGAEELIEEYRSEGNSVEVPITGNPENMAELEFIQQTLNNIGMEVEINALPTAEYIDAVTGTGEYDIAYWSTTPPIKRRVMNFFSSDHGQNVPHAEIPELDEAFADVRTSLDVEERQDAWGRVQEVLNENFVAAWYGPWIGGNVMDENIELGNQVSGNQVVWISELSPGD